MNLFFVVEKRMLGCMLKDLQQLEVFSKINDV